MRPDPSTMSDAHLLDEYLVVYRDAGRRRQAIRAELESRLSSAIIDAEADGKRIAKLAAELDAARAEVERLRNHINSAETAFCVELGAFRLSLKQVDAVVDALRADLHEAMELLRAHGQAPSWLLSAEKFEAVKDWNRRYGELLAKHKEAT